MQDSSNFKFHILCYVALVNVYTQPMTSPTRALLQIHFCVVLWGFTAIIGKAITLSALPLVWWRMILVTAALLLIPRSWTGLRHMRLRLAGTFAGIGLIVAMHWLAFYGSIKLSNASVAATCMAFTPLFTAFIEPLLIGRSFDIRELFFGVAVIPGVALLVGGTPAGMRIGFAVGVLSAVLAAIFGVLNKRFIEYGGALSVTGLEMAAGAICLTALAPLLPGPMFIVPSRHDAILLFILAMACTLLPFALSLVAQRHLTAFTTALAVNMEPVYAIVLAIILFGEQRELTAAFYAGVTVVFGVVFFHAIQVAK
jgi:drug/metabolite transporter (DMT)-like permease